MVDKHLSIDAEVLEKKIDILSQVKKSEVKLTYYKNPPKAQKNT